MRSLLLRVLRGGDDAVDRDVVIYGGSRADCSACGGSECRGYGGIVGAVGRGRDAGRGAVGKGGAVGISSVECGGVPGRGSLEGREGFCFDLFFGVSNYLYPGMKLRV